MPKCLVLTGHPFSPSFSGALADRYSAVLSAEGVEIRRMDISALSIPELTTRSPGDAEMVGDVKHVWDNMVWADHVVIIHPLWWGGMPARLKALFDVTLQSGKAYRYEGRNPLPLGLLKGRSARLVVTSDTPNWFMAIVYGNAHFRAVKNQILKFVGLNPVFKTHLSVMRHSTPEQRAKMLTAMETDAGRDARYLSRLGAGTKETKMAA